MKLLIETWGGILGVTDNIDYTYILGSDIETSTIQPDSYIPYSNDSAKDIEKMNAPIQVPYLNNTMEININTGMVTSSVFKRTIREWIAHLNSVSSESRIRIVYCHNLFYEMTFIMKEMEASIIEESGDKKNPYGLQNVDGIMRGSTDIVYARIDCCPHVIFRDSLALFNCPLKKLGNDINVREGNKDNSKLDYDYKKVRLPWDEMEQLDYDYNERDNYIVLKSIHYFLKDRGLNMEQCPLTATADVKRSRREYILESFGEKDLKNINWKKYYAENSFDFYSILRSTYQGGFTGSNINYVNKVVKDVYSVDIKSSYPYQMVHNYFPYYSKTNTTKRIKDEANEFFFKHLFKITSEQLLGMNNKTGVKGYYAMVELENVRIKNENYLLDLSYAHVIDLCESLDLNGVTLVNGKIKYAKHIALSMNNIDMDKFTMLYDYDNMVVSELWTTSEAKKLPSSEIAFILENFMIKESIDKKEHPVTYNLSKAKINSMYGVKVQNEVKDFTTIIEGVVNRLQYDKIGTRGYENLNITKEEVYENAINKGGRNGFLGGNFDIYSDGVYITSYARMMLMKFMKQLTDSGMIVIYADTDSLKFTYGASIGKVNALQVINDLVLRENNKIVGDNRKNRAVRAFSKYARNSQSKEMFTDIELAIKKVYNLGIWEVESVDENDEINPYSFFKTLGAKKYAYMDYEGIHTTIAGCNKKFLPKAIEKYAHKEKISLEISMDRIFTPGTLVNESASGRTVASYEKRSWKECRDLTYRGRLLNSAGGVVITDSTYFINVSENDSLVLGEVQRFDIWVKSIDIEGNVKYNNEGIDV